jgi:hypothetical protein
MSVPSARIDGRFPVSPSLAIVQASVQFADCLAISIVSSESLYVIQTSPLESTAIEDMLPLVISFAVKVSTFFKVKDVALFTLPMAAASMAVAPLS